MKTGLTPNEFGEWMNKTDISRVWFRNISEIDDLAKLNGVRCTTYSPSNGREKITVYYKDDVFAVRDKIDQRIIQPATLQQGTATDIAADIKRITTSVMRLHKSMAEDSDTVREYLNTLDASVQNFTYNLETIMKWLEHQTASINILVELVKSQNEFYDYLREMWEPKENVKNGRE